jgi:hypothetical protein
MTWRLILSVTIGYTRSSRLVLAASPSLVARFGAKVLGTLNSDPENPSSKNH